LGELVDPKDRPSSNFFATRKNYLSCRQHAFLKIKKLAFFILKKIKKSSFPRRFIGAERKKKKKENLKIFKRTDHFLTQKLKN